MPMIIVERSPVPMPSVKAGMKRAPRSHAPASQVITAAQRFPEERGRRDIFDDAGSARATLVGGGGREAGRLHNVEVIEQPDPEHARDDMDPAGERRGFS